MDDKAVENLKSFLERYCNQMVIFLNQLPIDITSLILRIPHARSMLNTLPVDVWNCSNGFIFAFKNGFDREFKVNVINKPEQKVHEVFNENKSIWVDAYDIVSKAKMDGHRITLTENAVNDIKENMIDFNIVPAKMNSHFYQQYSRVLLVGQTYAERNLYDHLKFAQLAIESCISGLNLDESMKPRKSLASFKLDLEHADKESAMQKFFNTHPYFIVQGYVESRIKPKIGNKYEADYAFRVPAVGKEDWIFVEIENPRKKIFTSSKNPQFTKEFTQAKGQLLSWEAEIRRNPGFYRDEYPGLDTPKFLLIFGRSNELDGKKQALLQQEFGQSNNRDFMTYDDVYSKFKETLNRLNL